MTGPVITTNPALSVTVGDSAQPNATPWVSTPVQVSLKKVICTDWTGYRLDGSPAVETYDDTAVFTVSKDGLTTITYYAFRRYIETKVYSPMSTAYVRIDRTGPTVTENIDSEMALGAGLKLAATDPYSGYKSLQVTLDGVPQTVSGGAWAGSASALGSHTLAYTAVDKLDNTRTGTIKFTVKQPQVVSISAPSVVNYNYKATVTGTVKTKAGAAISGRTVTLQTSTNGTSWSNAGTTTTSSTGAYKLYSPALTTARYVRAVASNDATYVKAASASRLVKPKVYLTAPSFSGKTTLTYGKTYTAAGYLKPRHAVGSTQITIKAYRYESGRGYVYKKTYSTKISTNSTTASVYKASVKLPAKGKWRVRAYHATDSLNAATYSTYRYVTVN